ncbi:S1C family serine protease [Sanguibacter sp. HDW7]|uniref:S1C family serine protease n=1 Tax=Sanguibacter sp. HDW7 TaxID=2714931 RepID=UPI00140AA4F9|nr:trypsin-like peptidase domain-containing protein [Sanguibacter sp. HDW7]QIK82914.1 PDZ domain-containing protein [Sanguibacter sp. HDW7]
MTEPSAGPAQPGQPPVPPGPAPVPPPPAGPGAAVPASPFAPPSSPGAGSASPYAPHPAAGHPTPAASAAMPSGGPAVAYGRTQGSPVHAHPGGPQQPFHASPGGPLTYGQLPPQAGQPHVGQAHVAQPQGWGPPPGVLPSGRPRPKGRGLGAGAVVGVIVLGLVSGAVGAAGTTVLLDARNDGRGNGSTVVEVPGKPSGGTADRAPGSVAGVAAAVLPSVVSLEVRGSQGSATGSGFVYSADGFIITNNHVVAGASGESPITVTFSDGTELAGTVVGRTEGYDLAVVKVERTGLVPLTLGDSEVVVVGDPVIAIGAPLGLEGTVTTGIVSALNRPVTAGDQGSTSWINALQTDAAINPGNSGGPLVNLVGEVVGVNSAIAQAPGSSQGAAGSIGLGFAIPANQVRRTAQQLIETGTATRPIIGALLDNRYEGEGVRILRTEDAPANEVPVTPGGPADKAGIKPGDVIVGIDGRPVTQEDELLVAIRALAPGDTIVLTIREGSTDRDVSVVLDEADAD